MIILDALFPSWQKRADRLLDQLLRHLLAHDVSGVASLFAADSVLEMPFAPLGCRGRVEGQESVAESFACLGTRLRVLDLITERRHYGAAGTVVWELELDAVDLDSDTRQRLQHIIVVDVADDEIVSFRDYGSPVAESEVSLGADG